MIQTYVYISFNTYFADDDEIPLLDDKIIIVGCLYVYY